MAEKQETMETSSLEGIQMEITEQEPEIMEPAQIAELAEREKERLQAAAAGQAFGMDEKRAFIAADQVLREDGPVILCANDQEARALAGAGFTALAIFDKEEAQKIADDLSSATKACLISALDPAFYAPLERIIQDAASKKGAMFARIPLPYYQEELAAPRNNYEGYQGKGPRLLSRLRSYLQENAGDFAKAATLTAEEALAPDNTCRYIKRFMAEDQGSIGKPINTGFKNLDDQGAFYPGLYLLAAISSLGKTSFLLQMADQMAKGGNHVLYFSLEQTKLELVSKSLARYAARIDSKNAPNALQIRFNNMYNDQRAIIEQAKGKYMTDTGGRLSIIESTIEANLTDISCQIEGYINHTGTSPVVIIDYLQIIQPQEEGWHRDSTKDTVDKTVKELKRIANRYKCVVIAVSSLNRASYKQAVNFEALKESGSLEYTADVVLGLQLSILNSDKYKRANQEEREKMINNAKGKTPRALELIRLKNRFGRSNFKEGQPVEFNYFPANDLFEEA